MKMWNNTNVTVIHYNPYDELIICLILTEQSKICREIRKRKRKNHNYIL